MADLDSLKPNILVPQLIDIARTTAGPLWDDIRSKTTHEFRILAHRIREIGSAIASGELSIPVARILFKMAKRNLVATIAMLTIMVEAAVQKLVNTVLKELKDYINGAIGFSLI